jgi:predicted alpha/beta-fold hydrolase
MTESQPYRRPATLFNRHLETIYPSLFRKPKFLEAQRERLTTPDQDFLDLDWYRNGSSKLVIISHGLEGNSKRGYVLGMARAFLQHGYDVLTWNYRGCSEELNRQPRFYHSGATDDLHTVVQSVLEKDVYNNISLVGFSLGGNLTLKYLGEDHNSVKSINQAVAISVPMDLGSSSDVLGRSVNWLYTKRFLISLKKKVVRKAKVIDLPITVDLDSVSSLREFDDHVTAPLHGFKDADDYYIRNSSLPFLPKISCPTLILNAKNDPFLSPECYPAKIANPAIQTQYPAHGGHVGFTLFNLNGLYWSEIQAVDFVSSRIKDV